jgi:dTDP-4-amino-4,6-dideoxygalactose transaminase
MSQYRVPFNRPCVVSTSATRMAEALAAKIHAGDGEFTRRCQQMLTAHLGAARVLLTTSCTHALEMSALLLEVGPGDEVIVPSFTFVSTANAFALRGARVVFADVRPDTLNLDEARLESLVTPRTKAIVPVHYAGVGCEMDSLCALAGPRGIALVEDNAHGLFGSYRGRPLGSFGALATQSFHETKNLSCGEGGALVINDARLVERAEIIREKGTNRSRFFRGQVDKYTWVDLGSSYLLSDLLAALLSAQLEQSETIQARRQRLWQRYREGLAEWARAQQVALPVVPAHCQPPAHLFHLLLPSLSARQALIAHLKQRGIQTVFHYLPLHLSEFGRRCGGQPGDCPVAEDVSDRLLRLPLYFALTDAEQEEVIAGVQAFNV